VVNRIADDLLDLLLTGNQGIDWCHAIAGYAIAGHVTIPNTSGPVIDRMIGASAKAAIRTTAPSRRGSIEFPGATSLRIACRRSGSK
jgi:hypothetical protein